jgi:3-phenylpropionate/trans-cinnamate dioxygenase ferredoxin reductase subunit
LTPVPFAATTFPNDGGYDELVVATGISFHSMCEHHLLPFVGVAHVGSLPGERIIGLSKLAPVVESFARSLQVQERLTTQVAVAEARVHDQAFYDEHGVELLTGRAAIGLGPGARELALDDGSMLGYDRLLIAPGAAPGRPPIPGAGVDGVRVLRTVEDADVLRQVLARGGRLAVIGAGWIGSEVAATARSSGAHVTLIARGEAPLQGVLGRQIGEFFAGLHRSHGVELVTAPVERIEAGPTVILAGGRAVAADAVVLGVGVALATALGESGGLRIDNGIVTDERLRTSAPGVFAAGGVANAYHPRDERRIRVEHWANVGERGAAAARSMLDRGDAYTKVPFLFSDQYHLGMEYSGLHDAGDRLVIRGSSDAGTFQAFRIGGDGRLTAAMHANDWDASGTIARLVESGARVDAHALGSLDVALEAVG